MRIAFLSYAAIPSRFANAIHVMKVCQALAKLGHQVSVFARAGEPGAGDAFQYHGVARSFEIVPCWRPARLGEAGRAIWRRSVMRAIRARPLPDLFYGTESYTLARSAAFGKPVICQAHTPPEGFWMRRAQGRLFQRPNFYRLVTITEALRQEYQRLFPWIPEHKHLVIPNAADIPQSNGYPPAGEWRGRPGRLQVGYAGHLYPGRGIEVIIAAARRLPEMDFHVLGGTPQDIAHWRRTAADVPHLRIHGYVPPERTEAFRQAMDVLLAPYQQAVLCQDGRLETSRWMSPMKVFEYMASRKPIIASDLPVLREVLRHGVNAILVPPADVDAWVRALQELGRDAVLRERLAAQAFHDVTSTLTWEAHERRILEGVA